MATRSYLMQIANVMAHLEKCRKIDPDNAEKYEQEMGKYLEEILPTINIVTDLPILDDLIQIKLNI